VFIAFKDLKLPTGYEAIDIMIDMFYIVDIVIIFRTGLDDEYFKTHIPVYLY
jgi:hypothetical protein